MRQRRGLAQQASRHSFAGDIVAVFADILTAPKVFEARILAVCVADVASRSADIAVESAT